MALAPNLPWLWILGIVLLNAPILLSRANKLGGSDPALVQEYRRLALGVVGFWALPFLYMGLGVLVGAVPTVFHYALLRTGNPVVLGFYALIFAEFAVVDVWVFLRGGAEYLARHRALFVRRMGGGGMPSTPLGVRWYCGVTQLIGVGSLVLLWNLFG